MRSLSRLGLLAILLVLSTQASALEVFSGKVTAIEVTYMPSQIRFYLDAGSTSCPAGSVIVWAQSTDNNKVVYATLLSALNSGARVQVYVNDGDASCTGRFLYVLK